MTHLDLFSGIGGFALAVDAVWPDAEHVFCEIDPFCQAILKKHWPTSKIYGDIRTLTNTRSQKLGGISQQPWETSAENWSCDLLTGGFPCQPFSHAGRRKGTSDDNGDGDALPCGDGCGIIGLCNGDTTISVQDAKQTHDGQSGEDIANPVRPSTKRNGEPRTSNGNEQTTGRGTSKRSTRFTNDMAGNANVVERATSDSSRSTTSTEGGTKNDGSTTARLGNSSSKTDTHRPTNSSATTATTQNTTSESALINSERVFLLTGGFPCQPFSQAGKRKGTEDERHLWPQMLRVIQEFSPHYVVGENVRGLLSIDGGMVFESVCADLEALGYEVQPFVIPACAVGAPHRRDRVWIVARNTKHDGQHGSKDTEGRGARSDRDAQGTDEDGKPPGSVVAWDDAQNTVGKRRGGRSDGNPKGDSGALQTPRSGSTFHGWGEDWPAVATRLCTLDDGLPDRLVRPRGWRNVALKAAGNAIVPAVAVEIMRARRLVDERNA